MSSRNPSPLVNDAFLNLNPYVPGKPISETERELGIQGVIKLASNENPLGPSPMAIDAASQALLHVHDYPDGGCFYLRKKVAAHLGVNEEQLIFGNGTNEIIEMLVRTCIRPDENLVFATPSFIIYKLCALAAGIEVIDVPLNNAMRFDLPAMANAITPKTKLLFIANPNNPTGTYMNATELLDFVRTVPQHVLIVLDEAYIEYIDAADYPNALELLQLRERFMFMRTFSKAYGLAGLRVGYGVANATLIDYLNRGREPFNVNAVAQAAAIAALDDTEHVARSRALNRTEMRRIVPLLRERGLKVWDSQANFVLTDFKTPIGPVFDHLLRQGVIVRPMTGYDLPMAARITIGIPEQNDRLLEAIDSLSPTS